MASKKSSVHQSDMTMKVVVLIALLAAFAAGYFVSRAKYKPQLVELSKMVSDKDQAMQKMKADSNKIIMKDDKMWVVDQGMVREMDSDIILSNGTKVMSDGKVVMSDGTESMMKNGDAVDMEGTMMPNGGSTVDTDSNSMDY